jgi:hypothetical protein
VSDHLPGPDPLASFIDELREPITVDPASKRRVMELVREAPVPVPVAGARRRLKRRTLGREPLPRFDACAMAALGARRRAHWPPRLVSRC